MKGGANIEDQLAIHKAVRAAIAESEHLDTHRLAALLDISSECCQSFVDFYYAKENAQPVTPVVVPVKKRSKKEVEAAPAEAFTFDSN